jgi:DNA-binding FadR family transcriptional regulator
VPAEQLLKLLGQMRNLSETVETIETDPTWSDRAMAADLQLHEVIQQHCSNRRLAHEIERYNILMRAIRRVAGNLYNVQLRAVSEHLRIINALLAEDAELARKQMSEHLESSARGVAKVMFQPRGD